jgi:hypothetical protein
LLAGLSKYTKILTSENKFILFDIINPYNNIDRKLGYVTIDNKDYLRYCGELQICKRTLPADKRVNVVGKIIDEELFLIDYIEDETKFRLVEK